jgi:hypothetical protein
VIAAIIIAALVVFDIALLTRSWRASRIKQRRAKRLRAMSGLVNREAR